MAENSAIEWTDHTFNPWRGCQKVSPGCANCYAETLSHRNPGTLGEWGPPHATERVIAAESYWRQPVKWSRAAESSGRRARVFCASLADVFEDAPQVIDARARLFDLIEATPWLDWLLLTKRPQNVLGMIPDRWGGWLPINVWLGTSVEDQERADERIPALLDTPAAVRFLSCEPLLGPVDLTLHLEGCTCTSYVVDLSDPERYHPENLDRVETPGCPEHDGLGWVIVGGESGPGARPMHPQWARVLRDQCGDAGVPFLFKQWGNWRPLAGNECSVAGDEFYPGTFTGPMARNVGKKAAGRELDGRTWDEFPEAVTADG